MNYLIIAIFFFLTTCIAQASDCKSSQLIAQESEAFLKKSFSELKSQFKDSKDESLISFFEYNDLGLGGKLYIADINNDGKRDLIFSYTGSGSGGYITLMVFSKKGEKFHFLGEPPKPKNDTSDGPWYFNLHLNPKTKSTEFLVDECGKIFMQFDLGGEEGSPLKLEKFLWANGETINISAKK